MDLCIWVDAYSTSDVLSPQRREEIIRHHKTESSALLITCQRIHFIQVIILLWFSLDIRYEKIHIKNLKIWRGCSNILPNFIPDPQNSILKIKKKGGKLHASYLL